MTGRDDLVPVAVLLERGLLPAPLEVGAAETPEEREQRLASRPMLAAFLADGRLPGADTPADRQARTAVVAFARLFSIRVVTPSGTVIVRSRGRRSPRSLVMAPRSDTLARPRERRPASRSRAHAPPGDDGPSRPRRRCCCGVSFEPKRRDSQHCPTCRNAAKQAAYRQRRSREARESGEGLADLYASEVIAARHRDVLDGDEALSLRVAPSDRAAAALAVRELVARTFAALDSGRIDLARRAAAPIAREIFDELERRR